MMLVNFPVSQDAWMCLLILFFCVCKSLKSVLVLILSLFLQAEVTYLSQLRHENLVKLIGYYSEADNKLLVYEFMQRGSLENHLFKSEFLHLSWFLKRFQLYFFV